MTTTANPDPRKCFLRNGKYVELVRGKRNICRDVYGVIIHKGENTHCDYGYSVKSYDPYYDERNIDGDSVSFFYNKADFDLARDLLDFSPSYKRRKWDNKEFQELCGDKLPIYLKTHTYMKEGWIYLERGVGVNYILNVDVEREDGNP